MPGTGFLLFPAMTKSETDIYPLVHYIDQTIPLPGRFTWPFRYSPAEATRTAADIVMRHIDSSENLAGIFSEGKMLGVLIVTCPDGRTGFLAGFSGLAGGQNTLPYFVPPVIDLLDPSGHFKTTEAEISLLNRRIADAEGSDEVTDARMTLQTAINEKQRRVSEWKARMSESKKRRDLLRSGNPDSGILDRLTQESQFEKAQLKRISRECDATLLLAETGYREAMKKISRLKEKRQAMSEDLQKWIFRNAIVENALGERKSIASIFASKGLTPPGGTGECAAPKMLHYAYTHGLKPVAMGEFWYGRSTGAEVRVHGSFYPSCTSKCGPLLEFMTEGLDMENPAGGTSGTRHVREIRIIHEDCDIVVAEKPSGMLSVPGKTGEASLLEILSESREGLLSVHRLDMDTSGIIVFAKSIKVQKDLQRQFASREIEKRYEAVLDTDAAQGDRGKELLPSMSGRISLPLSADYENRPRQKVDLSGGKDAVTEYRITETWEGRARVIFHPLTGRTHQLRVHSAHPSGLGCPIKGDILYGSTRSKEEDRLLLHASYIKLRHPSSGCLMEFESPSGFISHPERRDTGSEENHTRNNPQE